MLGLIIRSWVDLWGSIGVEALVKLLRNRRVARWVRHVGRGRGTGGRRLISENHEQLVIRVYSNQKVIKFPVSEVSGGCWLRPLTPCDNAISKKLSNET